MVPTRITVDEVKTRLDRGEQFAFVDTRNPKAWGDAESKLPGAIRVSADEVETHLARFSKDRTVITYCVTQRSIKRPCGASFERPWLEKCSPALRWIRRLGRGGTAR